MDVDRKFIINSARSTGFQPDITEKAYRLAVLLQEIRNHPVLSKELILKGGTAINFFYLPLPRLSVDLDFNFIGGLAKEEADRRRDGIKRYLNDIFSFLKYQVSERHEYGLHQFFLSYTNSASNLDVIKTEVNYLLRISLLPGQEKRIDLPFIKDLKITTRVLALEEVYGGKIVALLSRGAARDLFDVYALIDAKVKFKKTILKKTVIFLGCLIREDFRKFSANKIHSISGRNIKTDLSPLLRKTAIPSREKMIATVEPFLKGLLTMTKREYGYVDYFFQGQYKPERLFSKKEVVDIESLRNHPLALWKQQHIQEWLKRKGKRKLQ